MEQLQNQIALVTGATRGIGKAIAKSLMEAGAFVWGVYGSDNVAAEQFSKEHSAQQSQFKLVKCDISQQEQVADLFAQIDATHERLDILINNAGIRKDSILALMKPDQWQQVIDINLTGTYLMSKEAVLLMMKNKYGRIISISSPVAHLGFPGQANYAASKAGQVAFTKSLSKEVAKKKITVNCVSPGFIATDFIEGLPKDQLAAYKKLVPMKRFGTTSEVADAVLFLASSRASYITGSVLEVTGGL